MCEASASWPPSTPLSLTGSSHGLRRLCTGKRPFPLPLPPQESLSCAPPTVLPFLENPASAPMQSALQCFHAVKPSSETWHSWRGKGPQACDDKFWCCSVAKKFLDDVELGSEAIRAAVVEFMPYSFAAVNAQSKRFLEVRLTMTTAQSCCAALI